MRWLLWAISCRGRRIWRLSQRLETMPAMTAANAATTTDEKIAELKGSPGEVRGRGYYLPYVHRRLAQMYGELGQKDRAVEHWNLFLEVFTDPDPELEYMVTEAREALAELAREG